jgi:hypothetical protein
LIYSLLQKYKNIDGSVSEISINFNSNLIWFVFTCRYRIVCFTVLLLHFRGGKQLTQPLICNRKVDILTVALQMWSLVVIFLPPLDSVRLVCILFLPSIFRLPTQPLIKVSTSANFRSLARTQTTCSRWPKSLYLQQFFYLGSIGWVDFER